MKFPDVELRDYDVIIPYSRWKEAALLIPKDAHPNTFGGWKCLSEGKEVDVWPGDLSIHFTHHISRYAWHPKSGTRLERVS